MGEMRGREPTELNAALHGKRPNDSAAEQVAFTAVEFFTFQDFAIWIRYERWDNEAWNFEEDDQNGLAHFG